MRWALPLLFDNYSVGIDGTIWITFAGAALQDPAGLDAQNLLKKRPVINFFLLASR